MVDEWLQNLDLEQVMNDNGLSEIDLFPNNIFEVCVCACVCVLICYHICDVPLSEL